MKKSEITAAVTAYARKYGWSVSTVRNCTKLRYAACDEYRALHAA